MNTMLFYHLICFHRKKYHRKSYPVGVISLSQPERREIYPVQKLCQSFPNFINFNLEQTPIFKMRFFTIR